MVTQEKPTRVDWKCAWLHLWAFQLLPLLPPFWRGFWTGLGGDWTLDTGWWGCRELGQEGRVPNSTVFQSVLMSFTVSFEIAVLLDRG